MGNEDSESFGIGVGEEASAEVDVVGDDPVEPDGVIDPHLGPPRS